MRHIYQTSHDARRKNLLKQQIKARMIKKLSGFKAQNGLTARDWKRFHDRFFKIMENVDAAYNEAKKLRDELEAYRDTGLLETEAADTAESIVEHLVEVNEGGVWKILGFSQKFKDRESR